MVLMEEYSPRVIVLLWFLARALGFGVMVSAYGRLSGDGYQKVVFICLIFIFLFLTS